MPILTEPEAEDAIGRAQRLWQDSSVREVADKLLSAINHEAHLAEALIHEPPQNTLYWSRAYIEYEHQHDYAEFHAGVLLRLCSEESSVLYEVVRMQAQFEYESEQAARAAAGEAGAML